MSRPASNTILNQYLTLSECHPDCETSTIKGVRQNTWWLYDKRAYNNGMNIGMREKTRDEAFVKGIEFWARRAMAAERELTEIKAKVNTFVAQFVEAEDEYD